MSTWAVKQSYGFQPIEVISESEKTVTYFDVRKTRSQKISAVAISSWQSQGVLPWRGDEDGARILAEKLTSVFAERDRRTKAANEYASNEAVRLMDAINQLRHTVPLSGEVRKGCEVPTASQPTSSEDV